MSGGAIAGNAAESGGGVLVEQGGLFSMTGGEISSNDAVSEGGGVCVGGCRRLPLRCFNGE